MTIRFNPRASGLFFFLRFFFFLQKTSHSSVMKNLKETELGDMRVKKKTPGASNAE